MAEDNSTVHQLDYDLRPEIQLAFQECWKHIIEYNCSQTVMDNYGAEFKQGFYRDFQKVYYLSRHAFDKKRKEVGEERLDQLLKNIESWINKLAPIKTPGKSDILKGHDYLVELEPYLFDKNLVVIVKGMTN